MSADREKVMVRAVFDAGQKYGFVYTRGLEEEGLPEMICVDVPLAARLDVFHLLMALLSCSREGRVVDGYKMEIYHYTVVTVEVNDPAHASRFQTKTHSRLNRIILVKPLLDEWIPFPSAPEGKDALRKQVIDKWNGQRFIRFIDGNRLNYTFSNLCPAYIHEALVQYPSSTDWDLYLNPEERAFVQKHWHYFVCQGLVEYGKVPTEHMKKYAAAVAENIVHADERYKHGDKLAPGHYTWELEENVLVSLPVCYNCDGCGKQESKHGEFKVCSKCEVATSAPGSASENIGIFTRGAAARKVNIPWGIVCCVGRSAIIVVTADTFVKET